MAAINKVLLLKKKILLILLRRIFNRNIIKLMTSNLWRQIFQKREIKGELKLENRINTFSTALLKPRSACSYSRLIGLEGGVKMLLMLETSAWSRTTQTTLTVNFSLP